MTQLLTKDDCKIYYNYTKGDSNKPCMVFVHGILVNWTFFKREIKFFRKKGYPILYLDLRGHGKSSKPISKKKYKIESMAKDIFEILNKEKINNIFIIGHSLGGMVASFFALKYPNKTKKLILIDTSYNPSFFLKMRLIKKHINFIKTIGDIAAEKTKKINRKSKEIDFTKIKNLSDHEILAKALFNSNMHSFFSIWGSVYNFNLTKKLIKIKADTLVIGNKKDQIFDINSFKGFKKIPKCKIKIIEGTHSSVLKRPKEIVRLIEEFINNKV